MEHIFKRGDRVTVKLTSKHELDGDHAHAATFLYYHIGQEWAAVELDHPHATPASPLLRGHQQKTLNVPVSTLAPALEENIA